MTNSLRTWLIAALTNQELPPLAENQVAELVEAASNEGVLVLLEHRLQSHPHLVTLPNKLFSQIQQEAKLSVMEQLPFHAEQKRVFQALNQAQIPFLVMKGAALGHWLYESPAQRTVTDIDLWFADQQTVHRLAEVLAPHGFLSIETSGNLIGFEQAFDKSFNGQKIRLDAHWAMFNSAVLAPTVTFCDAFARSKTIEVQGQSVKALSVNDALINSIGHRAMKYLSQQENMLKWLYDQHLLFSALNAHQWQELIDRNAHAGISDLTLDAIEQSINTFNTHIPLGIIKTLASNAKHERINRTWFQSWSAYQWHEMHAVSPKLSVRLKWLGQKLWPNPEAMRERYGSDDPAWKFMFRRIGVGLRRLFS